MCCRPQNKGWAADKKEGPFHTHMTAVLIGVCIGLGCGELIRHLGKCSQQPAGESQRGISCSYSVTWIIKMCNCKSAYIEILIIFSVNKGHFPWPFFRLVLTTKTAAKWSHDICLVGAAIYNKKILHITCWDTRRDTDKITVSIKMTEQNRFWPWATLL